MFTGIIKGLSKIERISQKKNSLFVFVKRPKDWKIGLGDSVSINGVCSTVKTVNKKSFEVEYMPETIRKTTVGNFRKGRLVNLEKSLKLGDLLSGHIVQGHIDVRGKITEVEKEKESKVMKIKVPMKFIKFIIKKGSIAVDGISLTVVDTKKDWFTVSLVSYTLEHTNLGSIQKGEKVNIEIDVLAKYLNKLIKTINN